MPFLIKLKTMKNLKNKYVLYKDIFCKVEDFTNKSVILTAVLTKTPIKTTVDKIKML